VKRDDFIKFLRDASEGILASIQTRKSSCRSLILMVDRPGKEDMILFIISKPEIRFYVGMDGTIKFTIQPLRADLPLKIHFGIQYSMGSSKNSHSSIQKTLRNVYLNGLKFRPPFQIIPDASFVEYFIKTHSSASNLREYLENLTGIRVKLLTTNCLLKKLRAEKNTDANLRSAFYTIKEFEILRHCCGATGQSESEVCLFKCTDSDNRYKYCIATGSETLREKLKNRPVPVFYLNAGGGSVFMQSPGEAILNRVEKASQSKMQISTEEKKLLQTVAPIEDSGGRKPRKNFKKKAKGPNPLSMRKKQK
jgi:rRNA-processing protein FCF1